MLLFSFCFERKKWLLWMFLCFPHIFAFRVCLSTMSMSIFLLNCAIDKSCMLWGVLLLEYNNTFRRSGRRKIEILFNALSMMLSMGLWKSNGRFWYGARIFHHNNDFALTKCVKLTMQPKKCVNGNDESSESGSQRLLAARMINYKAIRRSSFHTLIPIYFLFRCCCQILIVSSKWLCYYIFYLICAKLPLQHLGIFISLSSIFSRQISKR